MKWLQWQVMPALLLLLMGYGHAAEQRQCAWPAWEQFRRTLVTSDGRVVDPSDGHGFTTSEGQSYALFFALVADDRTTFRKVLRWTQDNLAGGDLAARLPAWKWGRNAQGEWGVLDDNSAADADLWIAYALLEAGRHWAAYGYTSLGSRLLARLARDSVADVPGLGPMLLPARYGFVDTDAGIWRFNPSYLPLQVVTRLGNEPGPWSALYEPTLKMLLETAPLGYVPDWVAWHPERGWHTDPVDGDIGSYDAIRAYLWAGMLADNAPAKPALMKRFAPMAEATILRGRPPEEVNASSGKTHGSGPPGFAAALLPMLTGRPEAEIVRVQLRNKPPSPTAYYNQVLSLFGQGWDDERYRFDEAGRLLRGSSSCTS